MIVLDRQGTPRPGWFRPLLAVVLGLSCTGCQTQINTEYGRSRGKSINGTNTLLALIRERGHPVRAAIRLNDVSGDWADVLIRFAPYPGPPSQTEASSLSEWLQGKSGRKVVYIPQDYDAGPEFWEQMLAALPETSPAAQRTRLRTRRQSSQTWLTQRPERAKHPAAADLWFGTAPANSSQPNEVSTCQQLTGPWAEGIDARAVALPTHDILVAENDENVLLSGDGKKLVISWSFRNEEDDDDDAVANPGGVLVVTNGSFLLNAGLLNKARRPLTERVITWIGDGSTNVAFLEGSNILDEEDPPATSPFHLLTVPPFPWIAAHLAVFGILFALALAVSLGRPLPERGDAIDRPSAHPIALGAILAQTRQTHAALEIVATYRRWRHPSGPLNRTGSAAGTSSSRRVPHA